MKIKTIGSLLSLPLFLTSYTNGSFYRFASQLSLNMHTYHGSHIYLDVFDSSAAITKDISF